MRNLLRFITILPKKYYRRIFAYIACGSVLAIVDFISLFLISETIKLYKDEPISSATKFFLTYFNWYENENTLILLFVLVSSMWLLKTILAFWNTRKFYKNLSKLQIEFAENLLMNNYQKGFSAFRENIGKNLSLPFLDITENFTFGIIGSATTILVESIVLFCMVMPSLVVDWGLTLLIFLIFTAVFLSLNWATGKWTQTQGRLQMENYNIARKKISNIQQLEHEIFLMDEPFQNILNPIEPLRINSNALANVYLAQQIPKYALEITIVLVGIISGYVVSTLGILESSLAGIGVIIATAPRIIPTALRVQTSLLFYRSSVGKVSAFNFINDFRQSNNTRESLIITENTEQLTEFKNIEELRINELSYKFANKESFTLEKLNFSIHRNRLNFIIGESGKGKTTLLELLAGLRKPTSGYIENLHVIPKTSIFLMPQETFIFEGTLEENITLGRDIHEQQKKRLNELILKLGILEFCPQGIDELLKQDGANLSGGQKQRIGLARALLNNPELLFLDEPTASLDKKTAEFIFDLIRKESYTKFIVVITHNIEYVQNEDNIIQL